MNDREPGEFLPGEDILQDILIVVANLFVIGIGVGIIAAAYVLAGGGSG